MPAGHMDTSKPSGKQRLHFTAASAGTLQGPQGHMETGTFLRAAVTY